jgi:hypothetical protein
MNFTSTCLQKGIVVRTCLLTVIWIRWLPKNNMSGKKNFYYYLHTLNIQSVSDCICLYQSVSLSSSLQSVPLSSSHKLLNFLSSSLLFHIQSSFPSIALDIQHLWKPFIVTSGEVCCLDWKIRLYFLIYEHIQSYFSTGGVNGFKNLKYVCFGQSYFVALFMALNWWIDPCFIFEPSC